MERRQAADAIRRAPRLRDIEIRLVGPGDPALLDNVYDDVFDEPVRSERLTAYLREPGHFLMVAIDQGLVIAQVAAIIHRHPDKAAELYIDEVGVAEPWRRRGLARAMMERMLAHGRTLGCAEAWVGTEPDNLAANRLYRRFSDRPGEMFSMHVIPLAK